MAKEIPALATENPVAGVFYPSAPNEFINLFAHFHRAEIARMAGWRDRIDRTTNWAITLVAAMLSVALSTPSSHHSVLIFAMILSFLMLMIESRRYRFFDVYRSRVRRLERNYYAKLFSPDLVLEENWQRSLSTDLQSPTFTMSTSEAVSRRLRRNYLWIFLILLAAWTLKIAFSVFGGDPAAAVTLNAWIRAAAIGPIPGWIVVSTVSASYGWIFWSSLDHYHGSGELVHGDAHV
jgi:uncharacterized membrane protein